MEKYHVFIISSDGSEMWGKDVGDEQLKDLLWILRQGSSSYRSVLEAMEDDGK